MTPLDLAQAGGDAMTKPNVSSATPAVREAFESIMEVFEKVSGGRPGEKHQDAILQALERLDQVAYSEGQEER